MELKDFIKAVIDDIFEAIEDENKKYSPDRNIIGGILAPPTPIKLSMTQSTKREMERISFELVVEEQRERRADGKIGISVIQLGADTGRTTVSGNAQKVTFSIPVYYPTIGTQGSQSPHEDTK